MTHTATTPRLPYAKIDIIPGMPNTLEAARQIVRLMFDLDPRHERDRENFAMNVEYYDLGPMQITTCVSSGSLLRRSPALVALTGVDHFIVNHYRSGGFDMIIEGNRISVPTGVLGIFDLSKTGMLETDRVDNLSLTVPRDFLLPLVADPDSLHGLALPVDSEANVALVMHLEGLWQRLPEMGPEEAVEECQSLAAMLAAALGAHSRRKSITRAHLRKNQFAAICRWIDDNLGDDTLGPDAITAKFYITRPTLYRMFEQRGGIMRYILQRRLERVFQDLLDPSLRSEKIGALLYSRGLLEQSSASRAFRSYFGVTPRQVRADMSPDRHIPRGPSTETFRIETVDRLAPILKDHKVRVTNNAG